MGGGITSGMKGGKGGGVGDRIGSRWGCVVCELVHYQYVSLSRGV